EIGENEDVVVEAAGRALGKLRPTRADGDAELLEAPKQRHRVADIEILVGRFGADFAIVEIEHAVVLRELEMIEAAVPADVENEIVQLAPFAIEPVDPGDALALAVLHLEDMGDGMRRPDIGRVDRDGTPPGALGGDVVAGFLQAEGVGAEDEAVARHALVPGVENA